MLAIACTLCHSDLAGQVRAALSAPDALAALAPAPAILAAWWLLTGGARAR
ncbi:hypothetical protein [Sphingomonas lenta]|uniref:hypothetical protein n=1 Tax=Sphingomonas lenta TaxID=1141887 RepID=UPI001595F04C|nr:hypothetical protein [Sphingomonas lenta]